MTNIEFSMDGGLSWRVWHRCSTFEADQIMARLKVTYSDTIYIWRKIEVES